VTIYLLDANVLIALTVAEHEQHDLASTWLAGVEAFAVCPIVEGALVRFLLRMGESVPTTESVLAGVQAQPRCQLWPDSISYRDVDRSAVLGHRHVTDAYLASLAGARGGILATLDRALVQRHPDASELICHPG